VVLDDPRDHTPREHRKGPLCPAIPRAYENVSSMSARRPRHSSPVFGRPCNWRSGFDEEARSAASVPERRWHSRRAIDLEVLRQCGTDRVR
jgi:hypothetical protein